MLRSSPFWFAIVLLGSMMPGAWAADPPCPSQITTAPQPPAPANSLPEGLGGPLAPPIETGQIDISADHSAFSLTDSKGSLSGNVVVKQGQRELRTDQAQIDRDTGSVQADGQIDYTDPLVHITGASGSYSQSSGADFSQAQFSLKQRAARGTAQDLSLTPAGVVHMKGVTFTTCPVNDESWQLKANSITLDTQSKVGTGRDARIDFMGVPILYVPWVSFPLSSDRKSGFLYPTIGNTSYGGVQLSLPYYFNILPNYDFTFEPTEYTKAGIDLGGEMRLLTANQHGELDWNYLPHDRNYVVCNPEVVNGVSTEHCAQGGGRDRVRLNDELDISHDWRVMVKAQEVSDAFYFEDFSQGPEGTSTAFLERSALISYRDEHWRIEGEVQQNQTIDYILTSEAPLYSPYNRPYARVPRLAASTDYSLGPEGLLHYGFDSEIVDFQRPGGISQVPDFQSPNLTAQVQGWRGDVTPNIYLDLTGPGYFVRPAFAWRATQYELQDPLPGYPSSPSRNLPIASFDSGLVFERDSGSHSKHRMTLEPRIFYLYVPYRNQDKLPVFDTALPDLNPVELFRTNRYVGADRMSDANQLSAGVTSRLFDTASGQQFLAVTVGQAYYFTPPRVPLPDCVASVYTGPWCPSTPLGSENRSDFVVQVAVNAFQNWSADAAVQWDPQTQSSERTQVNLQYKPANDSIINLSYRYQRYTFDQVELSGAWPIYRNWHVFLRDIYSLSDHEQDFPNQLTSPQQPNQGAVIYYPTVGFLERFAGFEYRACCWRVRLGVRRYVTNHSGSQDTGVWLQLELGGLASVGSASDTSLGQEIRGYVPPEGLPQRALAPLRGVW